MWDYVGEKLDSTERDLFYKTLCTLTLTYIGIAITSANEGCMCRLGEAQWPWPVVASL